MTVKGLNRNCPLTNQVSFVQVKFCYFIYLSYFLFLFCLLLLLDFFLSYFTSASSFFLSSFIPSFLSFFLLATLLLSPLCLLVFFLFFFLSFFLLLFSFFAPRPSSSSQLLSHLFPSLKHLHHFDRNVQVKFQNNKTFID